MEKKNLSNYTIYLVIIEIVNLQMFYKFTNSPMFGSFSIGVEHDEVEG